MQRKNKTLSMIAVAVILGAAIVSVISCSKNDQETVSKKGTITSFSPSQELVEPTITQFIQRYDDYKAGYKSGGADLTLGEAIWTLEAATNYTFQSPKDSLGNFTIDSIVYTVAVYVGANNEYYISEADAMQLYNNVIEFTGSKAAPENTELLVADLETGSISNGQVDMKIIAVAGSPFQDPCSLQSDDYWYAANDVGRCGGYPGGVGKDAADKINTLLNCAKQNAYWTDIDTYYNITSYNGPAPNYDPCFWGMGFSGNYTDCLSPTDIQYWNDWAEYVIDDMTPVNKAYIDCIFDDELLVGEGSWFHYFVQIRYGIPHEINPNE